MVIPAPFRPFRGLSQKLGFIILAPITINKKSKVAQQEHLVLHSTMLLMLHSSMQYYNYQTDCLYQQSPQQWQIQTTGISMAIL
jgi:hypothetical protein